LVVVAVAAAVAVLGLAAACGKKGDPLPPLPRTPQAIAGFTVAQRAGQLEVSMVAPRMTTGGEKLGVVELELLRLDGTGELAKAGKKQRFRAAPGERITETFALPAVGTPVRMAARAIHRGQPSPLGKEVTLTVQPAPPPPTALKAELRPTGVLLTWTMPVLPSPPPPPPSPVPSTSPAPGPSPSTSPLPSPSPSPSTSPSATTSPRAGASPAPAASAPPTPPPPPPPPRVRLYRRAGTAGEYALLLPDPLAGTTFEDTGAAQGQTLCYVSRLVVATDPLVESTDSPQACVDVKDVFPPAVPSGLTALWQDAQVEVSWSPSADADLSAYRVYRAAPGTAPERVAEVPAGTTTARDTPPAGPAFTYTLTAVDKSGNESAPSAPAEVRRP
jgi:hypothetical protein